jgi:hypothetical protein
MIQLPQSIFIAGTLLATILSSPASAAPCDPNAILRSNVSQYNENIAVWLSYVKDLQRTTDSSNSSSVGIGYAGFDLDWADANSLYQYIAEHEGYSLTTTDSISVLRSTLSPDSVRAYIACLNSNNPITVLVPDSATTDVTFPITVHWNPDYPAKDNQKLTVNVINGTIDGHTAASAVLANRSDEKSFTIVRDNKGKEKLYITASIFGKVSDPATIPPIPQFRVTLEPKFMPPLNQPPSSICRSGGCGTVYVKFDECVYPDTGSVLLPSTLKFVADKLVGDPRRSGSGIEPGADQFHACGYIYSSAGGNPDYNLISGRFMAAQTVLVPVDAAAPPASPRQPTAANVMENLNHIMSEAMPAQ